MTRAEFKRLREQRHLTQEQTAERLAVHRVTVARWESGETDIPDRIARLWERNLTVSGKGSPASRWEDDDQVHYYEYDTLEQYPGMDAFKVAEAYIYGPKGAALGIILTVSAQELRAEVSSDQAIREGRKALEAIVKARRAEVAKLTVNRSDLYTYDGRLVRRLL